MDTDDVDPKLDLEPEPDPSAPEAAGDPAAEAFARLEGELALMRRAVQHLAAERADNVIPDYGPTLTDMAKQMGAIIESLKDMAGHPAMQITPDSIGQRIAAAAEAARRNDQDRISPEACNALAQPADIQRANRDVIDACRKSAATSQQPVRCTVRIRSERQAGN